MFSLDGTEKYWLYNKPVDMRKSFNGLSGIVTNGMCASLKSGDVYIFMNASRNMMKMLRQEEGGLVLYAIRLDMGRMKSAVQTDGYEVYESFENTPGKRMIGCWAHVRRKFVEALDEDRKYASEAIVYISKLYKLETDMKEAGLEPDAIRERREKEAYPIIQDFEKWMNSVAATSLLLDVTRGSSEAYVAGRLLHRLGGLGVCNVKRMQLGVWSVAFRFVNMHSLGDCGLSAE